MFDPLIQVTVQTLTFLAYEIVDSRKHNYFKLTVLMSIDHPKLATFLVPPMLYFLFNAVTMPLAAVSVVSMDPQRMSRRQRQL